jgi:hypothetical protein
MLGWCLKIDGCYVGNAYKCGSHRDDQHMTIRCSKRDREGCFTKKFADVMSARNIRDITLKMEAIRSVPQDTLTRTFAEMCDAAINIYIQEQKKRYPGKSSPDIMREYHLAHVSPPPE